MDIFGLGSSGLSLAEKSLDFVSRATRISSSNIANADTPGFKARKLEFEGEMAKAISSGENLSVGAGGMAKTDLRHLPVTDIAKVRAIESRRATAEKLDGNSVDLDKEITSLADLNIKYSIYTTIAGKELGRLNSAISLRVK